MDAYSAQPTTRGLRFGAIGVGLLGVLWGASLGVRPVLAFGVAQLTVLALLWLYPRVAMRDLGLERFVTKGACEEDWVPVTFRITNRGRLPLVVPEVEDRFTPDKAPRRLSFVYPLLGARSSASARYKGECYAKRGLYPLGPAVLHVSCPVGLFSARVSESRQARLTVYPGLEPLTEFSYGSSQQSGYGGRARRQAGQGDVPLAVREYRPGDSLHRIHWPGTARRGRLTILDYERQLTPQLALFIDLSRDSLRGLGRQSTTEVAVRVAAAVAGQALNSGGRVSLHADGERPVDVRSGRGNAQLCRILSELATVRPNGAWPLSEVLSTRINGLARGQAVLAVIAPGPDAQRMLDLGSGLRERGHPFIAVLLDPSGFPLLRDAQVSKATVEQSFTELADSFLSHGCTVYVVRAGEPLFEAFYAPYSGRPQVQITKAMLP
jgi:uncharacterized protein (DUF58 family)